MPKRNSFSIDGMVDAQTPLTDNEDGLSNNEKVINEKNRCCRCTTSIGGKCKVKWSLARVLTTSFYTLSLIAMVLTSIELRESRYKDSLHNVGWFIAGVFVCLAVPLSVFDIAQHLHNFLNNSQICTSIGGDCANYLKQLHANSWNPMSIPGFSKICPTMAPEYSCRIWTAISHAVPQQSHSNLTAQLSQINPTE